MKPRVRRRRKRAEPGRARGSAISDLTAQRLSIYLRCLDDLRRAGVDRISSQALARQFQLHPAQIRKDLACFGEFGVRGMGYVVADLRRNLLRILGLHRERKVIILGAGNLGRALADYGGFNREGFVIAGLFDSDARKVGRTTRGGVRIRSMRSLPALVRRSGVSIAILAVPASAAQRVLDQVVAAGVRAILNFAPARPRVGRGVIVKAVDLKIQLENLVFHLGRSRSAV